MAITGILRFLQTYKNIGRIRHIVSVLLKHGFGQFIEQINLHRFIPLRKRLKIFGRWQTIEKHTTPERLRMVFSELGPSFIKLAQILSSRPDIITSAYAEEFNKLQDKVPPFPAEEAGKIIESELERPLKEIFTDFDKTPVAAASIAQVHNATLKNGEKVIVKVQRPDIREMIDRDISILGAIARLMIKYIPESKFFNPEGIVDEFSKAVRKELDFRLEARNAQHFEANFAESCNIYIPAIHRDLLSEKVIVMERLDGVRIDDIKGIESLGIGKSDIAKKCVEAYLKMIFEDGFFHADPHPGNIFVMPDGRIGFMDFGIVGWLTPDVIENMARAFLAFFNKDFDALVARYIDLGLVAEEIDIEIFKDKFKTDLMDLCENLYGLTISEINFIEYLGSITHIAIKHGLKMPSNLLLMNKTMLIFDNIVRQLDPNFDLVSAAEPYAAKLVKRRLSPQGAFERTKKNLSDVSDLLIAAPKQINRLLGKALKGELGLKINTVGMDKLIKDIDRSSNRLAFSIIVAAIIVGSSLLIQSGIGGKVFGLPTVGAIGFFVAFVLGFWLLISILRSGRL